MEPLFLPHPGGFQGAVFCLKRGRNRSFRRCEAIFASKSPVFTNQRIGRKLDIGGNTALEAEAKPGAPGGEKAGGREKEAGIPQEYGTRAAAGKEVS